MPKLTTSPAKPQTGVQFMFSESLDLLNAMYFTHFVEENEGVEGWPVEVRRRMAPDLLAELDYLYTFPNGEPGLMGQLGDAMFYHPETWDSVESLLRYVRNMPLAIGESEQEPGVQGLAFYLACLRDEPLPPMADDPREALRLKITADGVDDVEAKIDTWDHPEELRDRMANLIERFYNEHYKDELPKRRACLERSVAAHRGSTRDEAIMAMRRALNRPRVCLEDVCPGPFEELLFMPSVDMGPWASCAELTGPRSLHGMFYPCEAEFMSEDGEARSTEMQIMARMYKALGDEQRIRILYLLRDNGEMYAQEVVDKLGLHQSVVSRHLGLLRAVGLLSVRKQNNMKFYSPNPIAGELMSVPGLVTGEAKREVS